MPSSRLHLVVRHDDALVFGSGEHLAPEPDALVAAEQALALAIVLHVTALLVQARRGSVAGHALRADLARRLVEIDADGVVADRRFLAALDARLLERLWRLVLARFAGVGG